jgi:hypothetical protein
MENESNKQTAVEWLAEQFDSIVELYPSQFEKINNAIEQAKQLERNQHGDTWDAAIQAHEDRGHVLARSICDFDDYFNETFGGENAK